MFIYHCAQLLLACVVAAIVVERARVLLFEAPLDTAPWLRRVVDEVVDGDLPAARAVVALARPAWVAQVADAILRGSEGDVPGSLAPDAGAPAPPVLDEIIADFEFEALRRLPALRTLASVATATGFLGAILDLIWLLSGDHGLLGLAAGLPQKVAAESAMLSVTAGFAISFVALSALGVLRRAATGLLRDVRRTAADLEGCLGAEGDS